MTRHRMEIAMTPLVDESPAAKVMNEAIDLAIEERSPHPDQAAFIDADTPYTETGIKRAAANGRAAVLCYPDGSTKILTPENARTSSR